MIQKILIVSAGGLSVFYHDFTEYLVNPQLVAGFTTAINSFSEQIIIHNQNIESIQMTALKMRIAAFLNNSVHLILFHNRYDSEEVIDSIIVDLQLQFIEMFGQLEMYEFAEISRFDSYKPIVEELCKTRINIGIVSSQSDLKQILWKEIFAQTDISDQHKDWNVYEFTLEKYPHIGITLWNFDYEAFKHSLPLLSQKQLIYLVIEPDFDKILSLISKIEQIRQSNPKGQILGIFFGNVGLYQNFAEIVLQIPIFPYQSVEDITHENLLQMFHETVLGV